MIVRSSHLSLRFYAHDLWNEELISKYVDGPVVFKEGDHFGPAYWIPQVGTHMDAQGLMDDGHIAQNWAGKILSLEQSFLYFKLMNW